MKKNESRRQHPIDVLLHRFVTIRPTTNSYLCAAQH